MKWRVASTLSLFPLLSLVLCTVSLDPSQVQVFPDNGGISGVFIAMLKGKDYSFNATTATQVCMSLSARIASKADVEMARSNGLQTCRYGWVKEQVAVIPRIDGNEKCGQNKVGIVTWRTPPSRLFDVFCLNSTDQSKATTASTPGMTMPVDKSLQPKTTTLSIIQSTLLNKNILPSSSSTPYISSYFTTSVASTFFSSSADSSTTQSITSLSLSTTQHPLPTPSSSSAVFVGSTILSSHSLTTLPPNTLSNQTDQPVMPPSNSFGDVPTASVTITVMLILMAAGGIWCFKIKAHLPPWIRIRNKEAAETEMWKHIDPQNSSKKKRDSANDLILQLEEDTESP